jgi:hypothetical protein
MTDAPLTAWDRQRLWEREQKARIGIGPTPAGNPHAEVMCCALCGRPPAHHGDGMTDCETESCGMWGLSIWWRQWNRLQAAILERARND